MNLNERETFFTDTLPDEPKVKCLSIGSSALLTVGGYYDVVHETISSYYIKNDGGVVCPYLKENFKEETK